MSILDALILGILQGISEFLPISSSGHLVLGEHWLGLDVEGLKSFDVLVHVATLLAILVYFWRDVWGMIRAIFIKGDPYRKLIGYIVLGTIPAVLIGLFGGDMIDYYYRNVAAVSAWMIVVAIVFFLGEYAYKRVGKGKINLRKAMIIGAAQAFALIPGVSRSGSTIVAGLFQGIKREEAARFSFLLGIPAIAGAGLLTILGDSGAFSTPPEVLLVGFVASFLAGIASIAFLMKFLKKHSLAVFAVYLLAIGSINLFL